MSIAGLLGWLSAIIAGAAIVVMVVSLIVYIYTSLAMYTIGKKLGYKNSWLAWIPIANIAMILQLGGFHWAFVFLILIPFLGWLAIAILIYISLWRIYEKRKYPGWLSLIILGTMIPIIGWVLAPLAHLIIMGFVAWKDK
jgi:uncharacterized membrane protein YfhO